MTRQSQKENPATVLVVEDAILIRMAIAAYLRRCGYRVIEAATTDEALLVLPYSDVPVDVVFSGVDASGALSAFALSQWVREHRPSVKTVMAGSLRSASAAAGQLCEEGPQSKKPYEPQVIEDQIRRLLALQRSKEPQ